jgi:hypothetical protein
MIKNVREAQGNKKNTCICISKLLGKIAFGILNSC